MECVYILVFRGIGMVQKLLRDNQWRRIEQLLPGKASDPGCTAKDNRLFVEACVPALRGVISRPSLATGTAPMCDLLAGEMQEQLFIDSTIVRAYQHSAGAQKKR